MYYLFEHQLGYHSLALGFPSIDGCNAICLQTKTGLFGVHVLGCNSFDPVNKAMENEAKAFAEFVTSHSMGKDFVQLYSACFHKRRYGDKDGKSAWSKELAVYAQALKFTGPGSGFDMSKIPNWPGGKSGATLDSTYVEYRRVFDTVSILYKPWSQCVHSPEIKASAIADGVNYRSANQKGEVTDKFRIDKAVTSVTTNGSGFVLSAAQLRHNFNFS